MLPPSGNELAVSARLSECSSARMPCAIGTVVQAPSSAEYASLVPAASRPATDFAMKQLGYMRRTALSVTGMRLRRSGWRRPLIPSRLLPCAAHAAATSLLGTPPCVCLCASRQAPLDTLRETLSAFALRARVLRPDPHRLQTEDCVRVCVLSSLHVDTVKLSTRGLCQARSRCDHLTRFICVDISH
jgi:hypothetical protein